MHHVNIVPSLAVVPQIPAVASYAETSDVKTHFDLMPGTGLIFIWCQMLAA